MDNPGLSIDQFSLLSVLGKGHFAKVLLVRRKDTHDIMAMKVIKKDRIQRPKAIERITTERQILINCCHPFITKIKCAFQDERKLYFGMEFCPGGELFYLLQRRRIFSEDQYTIEFKFITRARFYASQIILALEYLHSKDIVYREYNSPDILISSLKPENVLIDKNGYVRLCDFGLARMNIKCPNEAKSMCGTLEYLSPEAVEGKGHGKPVDWWALGCLISEMMTGMPVFYAENRDKMFQKIRKAEIKFPCNFSHEVKDLLSHLLEKNPELRWGEGVNGTCQIKEHSWFKDFDWEGVYSMKLKAPFVPILKNDLDLSYFDPEFTEIALDSARSATSQAFEPFKNFTYDERADYGNSSEEIF